MVGFLFLLRHLYSVKRFLGNVRAYITLQNPSKAREFTEGLVGWKITCDAESCFTLSIHKRKRDNNWAIIPQIRIQVHKRDLPPRSSTRAGHKQSNFLIWKEPVDLIQSQAHFTSEGLARIKELKLVLNQKTPKNPLTTPLSKFSPELLEYLVGFVDGDGFFSVCRCSLSMISIFKCKLDHQKHYYSTSSNSSEGKGRNKKRNRITNTEKANICKQLASKAGRSLPFKELCIGMILGDGWIGYTPNSKDAMMRIHQKDKVYVYYLYAKFKALGVVGTPWPRTEGPGSSGQGEPREEISILKPSGNIRIAYAFYTFTLPLFTELHQQCYTKVDGKRVQIIPSNIRDILTPIVLAYWLASDGCFDKSQGTVRIATHSLNKEEVEILRAALLKNYSIKSSIHIQRKSKGVEQYLIYIPKREVPKVQNLVKPPIPPMMASRVDLNSSELDNDLGSSSSSSSPTTSLGEQRTGNCDLSDSVYSSSEGSAASSDTPTVSTYSKSDQFLEYFVGFVDGAGSFTIHRCGNYYKLQFSISQALYNIRILYYIKSKLGYGSVSTNKNKGVADFRISDRKSLAKVIFPIFDTYLLRTSKYFNYVRFKNAYDILEDPNLSSEDKAKQLESLLEEPLPVDYVSPPLGPQRGHRTSAEALDDLGPPGPALGPGLRALGPQTGGTGGALKNLDPLQSPYEEISLVITDNWLSGYVEAEGCFGINRDGLSFNIEFFLVQKLDGRLLELIRRILHIPGKIIKNRQLNVLKTKNKRALYNIKDAFEGKFKGMKALEFKLWCKALYYRETNQPKVERIYKAWRKVKAKVNSPTSPRPEDQGPSVLGPEGRKVLISSEALVEDRPLD